MTAIRTKRGAAVSTIQDALPPEWQHIHHLAMVATESEQNLKRWVAPSE
jgi:hypothetical protein